MTKKENRIRLTLNEVGNFLAKFSEHSEQVYWISSPDFQKIQYISPSFERVWGRSREELYTNPELWITYLHPEDITERHPIHEMAEKIKLQGEKARYLEQYRIIRPNGEIRWIMDAGFPLIDTRGFCYGVTGIATDITEEKQHVEAIRLAKEAAEAANKSKEEFIANISHDIRTPITGIIGMAQLLEETISFPQEKQYIQWIKQSGNQLLELLNMVLEVVSTGNLKENALEQDAVNASEIINEIQELQLPSIKLKHLEFEVNISNEVPEWFLTDRIKLKRILLNLIGNAVKFTHKGKISLEVSIKFKENDQYTIEFIISDTGIGIPKELQDKVFERFFKSIPSYKGGSYGHGLGLHIAQKYAELLKGEITLTSTPNVGTTFFLTLPIKKIEAPKKENKIISLEQGFSIEKPILLVEDNEVALKIIESIVTKAGCKFVSATSAEEALELIKNQDFELIISDIGLPNMSGNDLTIHIREWEKSKNKLPIPIIGLTAHASNRIEHECLSAGMNSVLAKPMTYSMLIQILDKFSQSNFTHELTHEELQSEFFKLEQYPLLDIQAGINVLRDISTLREMLAFMIDNSMKEDLKGLEEAYSNNNEDNIQHYAHKIKSRALYCGTIRLKIACQYLENYKKSEYEDLLEPLYKQFCIVVKQTDSAVKKWLKPYA